MKYLLNACLVLFILSSCSQNKKEVDLIVSAQKIYTSDAKEMVEAMAIVNGKILETGSLKALKSKYKAAEYLQAEGYVFPGFIDAHSHFYGYGKTLQKVDLRNTYSLEEVVNKIVEFSKTNKDEWITGRGWDQTDWTIKGSVNNAMLSAYFPDKPVFIKRVDGHAGLANAKALALAGITTETRVSGGEIEVMGGRLTGLLTDNAMNLIGDIIPEQSIESKTEALLKAQENCFEAGLTSVTDAGLNLNTIKLIDSLNKAGILKIRIYAMADPSEENLSYFQENGAIETPHLQVSSFKIYADGALGSRGAKLKQPYCDIEDHSGVWVTDPSEIDNLCKQIDALNFQVNTHCIGDSANRKILEIYSKYLTEGNDKRWRIEHAQVVSPTDRGLFKQFGVIPSIQPTHATSDMLWAEKRLCKERMSGAYAYKSLLSEVGIVALGTDFPVEEIHPLSTFYAAVQRKNTDNEPLGGFNIEEGLTAKQTLMGMTKDAAFACRMDDRVGSLETGKLADFVILDRDIMVEKYMLETKINATYLAGKKVN